MAIKFLHSTEGATVMLPRTIVSHERKSRLRRGASAAIATMTLIGAAGIGYTLAPTAFQQQVQDTIHSWVGSDSPVAVVQDSNLGGTPGNYLAAVYDDSTASLAAGEATVDSAIAAMPDTVSLQEKTDQPSSESATNRPAGPTDVRVDAPVEAVQNTGTDAAGRSETPPAEEQVLKLGWLSISSDPGAEVYIDNSYRGDTPLEIELPAGTHALECRNARYATYHESIRITTGELSRRNVVLKQLVGHLTITATAGAEVLIDGVVMGITPLKAPLELAAGDHQVTVKKAGFNVWNNEVKVLADKQLRLSITLSPIY
jgi:hypothetical protein